MYKYFIELVGTVTILYAKLLTEGSPPVLGIVYFSILTIAHNITSGYFNPLSAFAGYAIGRVPFTEMIYNIVAQVTAMLLVIVSFTPITTFIKDA
jgi:glycerol uptake facilitator-like aquaporin